MDVNVIAIRWKSFLIYQGDVAVISNSPVDRISYFWRVLILIYEAEVTCKLSNGKFSLGQ